MLTVVGLCFALMICVPLVMNGVSQISDQYAYSQFQDAVASIDSGINVVANGTNQGDFVKDIYIPQGVTMNSSINQVSYYFDSSSISRLVTKEYPIAVSLSFNYPSGWYRVTLHLQNSTAIVASFIFTGN
jgi:hypothetical protein